MRRKQLAVKKRTNAKSDTLDFLHQTKLEQIKNTNDSLPGLRLKLRQIETSIADLEKRYRSSKDFSLLSEISSRKDQLFYLNREVEKIRSRSDAIEYASNTTEIMSDYYNNPNIPTSHDGIFGSGINEDGTRNILSYDIFKSIEPTTAAPTGKFLTEDRLYQKYRSAVDFEYQESNGFCNGNDSVCLDPTCDGIAIVSIDGEHRVCDTCGMKDCPPCDTEKVVFGERPPDSSKYSYNQVAHMQETLNRAQGKETVVIPEDVYDDIDAELERRLAPLETLTTINVREILKKTGHSKYYDHVTHIHRNITGIEPLTFDRKQTREITAIFISTLQPFHNHKPSHRTNYLTYAYALRKISEIMGMFEHAEMFTKLKNNVNLVEHDKIWELICRDIGKPFIKSI